MALFRQTRDQRFEATARVGEWVYRNQDLAARALRQRRARKRAILNAILNHRSIATAILVAKLRPWEA